MNIVLIKSYTDKPWRSSHTYDLIQNSLSQKWPVHPIHTQKIKALYKTLLDLKERFIGDLFVFNIAEYLDEDRKTGFIPDLLDKWGFPHLGSSVETIVFGLNKAKTKRILQNNHITTPAYFVARQGDPQWTLSAQEIGYPLIVKPLMEGGHLGIRKDSVVFDAPHLEGAIHRIFKKFEQPALVESFIKGKAMREFSVGIIDAGQQYFMPVEIDFDSMHVEPKILSYEAAQNDEEVIKMVHESSLRHKLIDLTKKTFAAIGARDYARVDLRMNQTALYVLEINTMPGLGPDSFIPQSAQEIYGLDYRALIQLLAQTALGRTKQLLGNPALEESMTF